MITRVHAVETIREFITGAAIALILDLPFLVVFLAIMFWYSWLLTLIALGFLATITVISLAIVPTLRRRINKQFLLGARNQAFLTEYISGIETVKSLQMEPQLKRTFGDYLASFLHAGFRTRQLSNTYNVATTTLEQLMTVSILCVGAWYVINNVGFTIGMLVAFNMFTARLSQPVLRIAGLWQEFQQAAIAVKRLGDVMNAPPEPYSTVPARSRHGEGKIEIENLSFRYGEDRPYLYQHLNLKIEAGSTIAIMGPSGSGKSTLAKLMQGFYQPTEGSIRIDGLDIRHLSANELQKPLRRRPAGNRAVLRHHLRQHHRCQSACELRADHPGVQDGRDTRRHRATPAGLPDRHRRTRRRTVRRTEATHRHRTSTAQAPEDTDLR